MDAVPFDNLPTSRSQERNLKQNPNGEIKQIYKEDEANKFLLTQLESQEKRIKNQIKKMETEIYLQDQENKRK